MAKKKHKKMTKKKRIIRNVLAIALIAVLFVAIIFIFKFGSVMLKYQKEAKSIIAAAGDDVFQKEQTSIIYDAKGRVITTLKAEKDAYYLSIEDIPVYAQQAMIATEDREFYDHHGVNYSAVFRAIWALIQNKGEITQGGSTITQQLCKNIYLTNDVTFERKIREMFIALEIEKKYSKPEIMEFYMNNIYFANGYYGIEAASQGYFNKKSSELTLSQIAFLCAIPNSPTKYDPLVNFDKTIERRDRVLEQMYAQDMITEDDYFAALSEQIVLNHVPTVTKFNYVETYVKFCATEELMERSGFELRYKFVNDADRADYDEDYVELYEECSEKLYTGGYKIYTSIDLDKQAALQQIVDEKCAADEEVSEEGVYSFQAAATCIDNSTGLVTAIVGGRSQDFNGYTLNRAYQTFRQPGSTIKPILVYTPALERGYTPDTLLEDSKISDECPSNADGAYEGWIPLRYAVYRSKNTTAWKLFLEIGASDLMNYLTDMEFSKIVDSDYVGSSAIGGLTKGVSTVEMASAYATIENDGIFRTPTCIVDMVVSGNEVYIGGNNSEKIIYGVESSRVMTNVLKDVLTRGTGVGFNVDNAICAAKTGTTNDDYDSWFCGYSTYYTLAVWTGYDYAKTIPNTTIAGSIWHDYMTYLHDGLEIKDFNEADSLKPADDLTPAVNPEPETQETETQEETPAEQTQTTDVKTPEENGQDQGNTEQTTPSENNANAQEGALHNTVDP